MSSENFAKLYKNTGKPEDNRRRRTDTSIELRKQKGNDEMMKRRNLNVDLDESFTSGGSDGEEQQQHGALAVLTASQPIDLKAAVDILQSNPSPEQIRVAFEFVRRTLTGKVPPIDEIIQLGFPFALVQALNLEDEKIQFEAAWGLTNIASGTSQQTMAVVKAGAVPPLMKLCAHSSTKLAEQAIWAIANIIGDGMQMRDYLVSEGVIPLFVQQFERLGQFSASSVATITWALSNLCRFKKPQLPLELLAQIAPLVATLLKYEDSITQSDACWALSYLTDGPDEYIELACKQNVLTDVVRFFTSGHDTLISPALRVLGNIATGNDELTQAVVDTGILYNGVPQLLLSNNNSFTKECCWLVSNILAGSQQQIQEVLDAQLLPMIFDQLENGEHRVQMEASWAVANLTHGGTANQILEICRLKETIAKICQCFTVKNNEMMANALDTLYNVLHTVSTHDPENLVKFCDQVEECGGLDRLETLQQHESEKIYQSAYRIIEEFFTEEEEGLDAAMVSEQQPSGQFNF